MEENTNDSNEIVREQSESVAATNLKVLGDGPAFVTNMAMQDQLEARVGWRTINQAIVGKVAESIIMIDPKEAGGDVAALGQLAKMMQTTPPVTAAAGTV